MVLYLISAPNALSPLAVSVEGIYRTRELVELPRGLMKVLELRRDATNDVIEMLLEVDLSVIRLLSGEVYEHKGNRFEIVELDESILIQVDGTRPRAPDAP